MKEVKNYNGRHWQVRCPECDAWHYVRVLARAELCIAPGVRVRRRWLDDPLVVCAECEEDVEFLLEPSQKKAIIDLAYST